MPTERCTAAAVAAADEDERVLGAEVGVVAAPKMAKMSPEPARALKYQRS